MRKKTYSKKKPTPLLRVLCVLPSLFCLLYLGLQLYLHDEVPINNIFMIVVAVIAIIDISTGWVIPLTVLSILGSLAPSNQEHDSIWFKSDPNKENI